MCNIFSCIVVKTGDVLWSPTDMSHSSLIKKYDLKEGPLESRNFVKVEINPVSYLDSLNIKDWEYRVDEKSTLPGWYVEDEINYTNKAYQVLWEFIKDVKKTKIFPCSIDSRIYPKMLFSEIIEKVNGYLYLDGTAATNLKNLKEVIGYFFLDTGYIVNLGKLEKVYGDFYIGKNVLTSLGNLKEVCGDFYLANNAVTHLGNLERVGGNFHLEGNVVMSLEKLKEVGGKVYHEGNIITNYQGTQLIKGETI